MIYNASKKQVELLKQGLDNGHISKKEYKDAILNSKLAYSIIGEIMNKENIRYSRKLVNECVRNIKNYDSVVYDRNELINMSYWDSFDIPIYCSDDM